MLTREQRAAAGALWLSRWQAWQSSGMSVAAYGRKEGFDPGAAYRWKRILRRTGQWVDGPAEARVKRPARRKRKVVTRFARVALEDVPVASSSMLMRLTLGNGQRAELEVSGVAQFAELIGALERGA